MLARATNCESLSLMASGISDPSGSPSQEEAGAAPGYLWVFGVVL